MTVAYGKYQVRSENINGVMVLMSVPVMELSVSKNSGDQIGTYSLTYPNPQGYCNDLFAHFREQEIWLTDPSTNTAYRVIKGQVNRINLETKNTLKIEGRSLAGLLTDKKVNNSYTDKRVDYILNDETYGIIALNFSDLTTWNCFTKDYDRFDYWDDDRWGTQNPSEEIIDGELEITGVGAGEILVIGEDEYEYCSIEFKIKVASAVDSVYIGLTNSGQTEYIRFGLNAVNVTCENTDGTPQSTPTTTVIGQTIYNYYRIEWANGEVRFYVNGVLEVTETSNIPTGLLKPFMSIAAGTSSVMTVDFMKVFYLTRKLDRYLVKYKLGNDIVAELCELGTETDTFLSYVDNEWDLNCVLEQNTDSGYDFGLNSALFTATSQRIKELKYAQESKDLYNKVIVRGGEKITEYVSGWQDQFIGNGTQKSYVLGNKAQKSLTLLEVNGVAKTEGTHFNVTYGKEHTVIEFVTAPANTHSINVRYNIITPIIATKSNFTSQDTYGVIREYVKEDENINSEDRARLLANSLLAFFSDPRNVINITVPIKPQLELGTTVDIDAPDLNINNQRYEIISLGHSLGRGKLDTTMTLANADIDTNSEIIRELLQKIKDIQSRGNTSEGIVEEYDIAEDFELYEGFDLKKTWVCDSFIFGHSGDNGRFGMGRILDNFEDATVGTDWTGTLTATRSDEWAMTRSYSMKLEYTGTGTKTIGTTKSFGDLSSYTGVASGLPSQGTIGLWANKILSTDWTTITMKIGSSTGDYLLCTGAIYGTSTGNVTRSGDNYYVFDLDTGVVIGTPNWTAVDYVLFTVTVASGTYTYFDYFTISSSNSIGLNGFGSRIMEETAYTEIDFV